MTFSNPDKVTNAKIQTFTGLMFDLFDPAPTSIVLEDIAHALSMICRYGGHSRHFYSVAEHSVLMAEHFEKKSQHGLARVAALHDATEAYLGDIVRPLKTRLPEYQRAEERLQGMILTKFGLIAVIPKSVKQADLSITNDERAALMEPRTWTIDPYPALGVEIEGWPPAEAEGHWLNTFRRLFT